MTLSTLAEISLHLQSLGWKRDVNYGGEVEITSPDSEYQVTFQDDWWDLGHFTDSDIDGVACGRYQNVEEGQTLEELKAAVEEIQSRKVKR